MTLDQWRQENRLRWIDVARRLSEQGNGPVFDNRLYRLRGGKTPTSGERAALYLLTDGDVESYKD